LQTSPLAPLRFGVFELDRSGAELRRQGVPVRLAPQPLKLLLLLASRPGQLVTRDEIRRELWSADTFVDFEQGVNFTIKQVREALGDDAEQPRFVQTVPKRGYRFIAQVEGVSTRRPATRPGTDVNLHKALWANIADMRVEEARRHKLLTWLLGMVAAILALLLWVVFARG
jgi:DNA-binding winged helix-turn-helix (wHTH) protein